MGLAVVDGDAHVLQRESSDEARLEYVAHSFLDRWNELVRNRAALHRVDELESLAAGQRLYPQEDFTKLSRTTGLLLVAVVALGLGRDRLAERHRRRSRLELEPVLGRHLVERRLEVHLAESAHHGLVRLRVVLDVEAGILSRDL